MLMQSQLGEMSFGILKLNKLGELNFGISEFRSKAR